MKHMRDLDRTLREKSQGQVGFRFYPGRIAGDELDVLKKIRIGQFHSTAFTGVGMGEILPMVRILDLPFLFHSYEGVDLVRNHLQDFFSQQFEKKGFVLLSWGEVGNVHLFSKKPIRSVTDMANLRVWVWTGDFIARETFSAMGTHPIQLPITDVTTALATGMIDTVYASPLGAIALQWHSHLKYMTLLPLAHSTAAVLIWLDYFNNIPEDLKQLFKIELDTMMKDLIAESRAQNEESIRLLEKTGMTLLPIPARGDLEEFHKVHQKVAERFAGEVFPRNLLERLYAILEEHR
jgi:TRAP-type C4-dicarboxylate transport system substrate-binding protein